MTVPFSRGTSRPLYEQAVALLRGGAFLRAEGMMQRSLVEEGETALSYHYLSEILSRLPDRVEDALQAQQQAADIAGDHPVFLAALGLRLHDAGKDVAQPHPKIVARKHCDRDVLQGFLPRFLLLHCNR